MAARIGRAQPYTLSLFRSVVGLLFTCHGVASLFGLLGGRSIPAGTWPGWYAAVIQLAVGALVLLGLGTRTAALLGSGSMAFAYFDIHQHRGLLPIENGGEAAVFFCWALLLIVFSGPGALAVDRLITDRRAARAAARAGGDRQRHLAVPV
ncbi:MULTISPECIES: DoxX family protein [unclassified Streptomyces]|uniref:DoxX family protein n=1 Tax=unclassified Streptomyces TaxID=2593676 RepID=UPI00324D1C6F